MVNRRVNRYVFSIANEFTKDRIIIHYKIEINEYKKKLEEKENKLQQIESDEYNIIIEPLIAKKLKEGGPFEFNGQDKRH